jgi:hypothetical protein
MSALDYATTSYPKNMSYHMERISNYAKQPIKVWCDRTGTINSQESIRFKLPANCLVDLDSLYWYFEFTAGQATSGGRFFPRNSSSVIDAMYVYANGNLIDPCTYYNHIHNLLTDASCGDDYFKSGLRYLENTDPSIKPVYNAGNGALSHLLTSSNLSPGDTDTSRPFVIRNWLGFLGTASTRVIDTGMLGDVVIEIRLAEPSITYRSNGASGTPTYTINGSTTYMSITRITFGDSVYYDLLRNIVTSSTTGLQIGYKTYSAHRGNSFTKAAGTFTHSFNVNANHLTKLIGTLIPTTYQTEGALQNTLPLVSWLDQLGREGTLIAFNQSKYFQKDGSGIGQVQWDINGISQYPQPLTPYDIFNQNLIALNMDSDIQSGNHAGCDNIYNFLKYYFMNILSFEHIQNTNEFVLEGFDGVASAISCKWSLTFDNVGLAGSLIPIVFAEKQQVLVVQGAPQNLAVM